MLCMHPCKYACVYRQLSHYECIHSYTYVHTYIYMHMHIYIHAYIHTYIRTLQPSSMCVYKTLHICITYLHVGRRVYSRGPDGPGKTLMNEAVPPGPPGCLAQPQLVHGYTVACNWACNWLQLRFYCRALIMISNIVMVRQKKSHILLQLSHRILPNDIGTYFRSCY